MHEHMKPMLMMILKGFGLLLFILLGIMILLPLGIGSHPPGKKLKTKVEVRQLEIAARAYRSDYGQWPDARNNPELVSVLSGSNLHHIAYMEFGSDIREMNGVFLDPWHHPYHFQVLSNEFRVWSSGPDGINDSGKRDDIVSWNTE